MVYTLSDHNAECIPHTNFCISQQKLMMKRYCRYFWYRSKERRPAKKHSHKSMLLFMTSGSSKH